jgi:hypothetical protein
MVKGILISGLFFLGIFAGVDYFKDKSWKYKKIPSKFKLKENTSLYNFTTLHSKVTYLVDYLPKGFVKNATQDYTVYIQEVLNNERNVIFPNFPLLINKKGLSISSSCNIFFNPKTILIIEKNDLTQYEVLRIHNVENVTIYNAKIQGDKHHHIGEKGEWGMGISIRGTKNIKLFNSTKLFSARNFLINSNFSS